jgi:acyl-CoA reductase-like NAD-dependent aldehyde dehydrogenase
MHHLQVQGIPVSTSHYINGQRVASATTFVDISPIDETVIGEVAAGGEAEVNAAVEAAHRAFPAWAALGRNY